MKQNQSTSNLLSAKRILQEKPTQCRAEEETYSDDGKGLCSASF
jgi:hypothetical protein